MVSGLVLVVGGSISTGIGEPNIPPSFTLLIVTSTLAIVFGVLLHEPRFSKFNQTWFDVIAIGAVSLYSVHLFLGPQIPLTHDLHFAHFPAMAVTKLYSQTLLVPRWTHYLWCGVPFSRVYSPLLFTLSAILAWLNPADTARTVFFLSYFLSGLTMYFSNKELFENRTSGLVSAVCYLLFGYHLLDSHVRGNPPETFAFVWIPLIFFFAMRVLSEDLRSKRIVWTFLCSLSIAATFWTHLLSGFIAVVWVALLPFADLVRKDISGQERIKASTYLFLAILLGLCSSAGILLPVIFEKDQFLVGRYNTGFWAITNHFVKLENFFIRRTWCEWWLSSPHWPMYLGNSILFLAICATFFFRSEKRTRLKVALAFLVITSLGSMFFSSKLAEPLGKIIVESENPVIGLGSYLQFPWRSLLLCAFSTSSLAGYTVASTLSMMNHPARSERFRKLLLSIVILLVLVDMFPYTGAVNQTAVEPSQELISAVEWLSNQEGVFRVYYCGHDFENPYWYLCGAGHILPTLPPGGAFREWSTVRSNPIIESALIELRNAGELVHSGYLSVKYVVDRRENLERWLSSSSVRVVKHLDGYVILENNLFRPFVEMAESKGRESSNDINGSLTVRRLDPENVEIEISSSGTGAYYAIVKESYFSAWSATVDGTPQPVEATEDGLMAVQFQAGSNIISLKLGDTPPERLGRIISLASSVGIVFAVLATILEPRLPTTRRRRTLSQAREPKA